MKNTKGFTFLEIVIAMSILIVILITVYALVFASEKLYTNEFQKRNAEFRMQVATDELLQEIRESSFGLTYLNQFTDPQFTQPQTLISMPSARDDNGIFQSINTFPSWQRLIVYAPYYNPLKQASELRRYEVSPINVAYINDITNIGATITTDQIDFQLSGTSIFVIDRATGSVVLSKIASFDLQIQNNQIHTSITAQGNTYVNQTSQLASGARGRN